MISRNDLNSTASLKVGLEAHVRTHFGACEVTVKDRAFPSLQLVRIDLSGGRIDAGNPPPAPGEFLEKTDGVTADRLEIEAHSIDVEGGGHMKLGLAARDVELQRCIDTEDREWLAPHRASEAHLELEIDREGIGSLFLGGVLRAAEQHGVSILETDLRLSPHGADSVLVEATVVAKKVLTAKIVLSGKMKLDARLQAHFSDLTFDSQGAIGRMVSAFMGPKLRELESKAFPLLGFRLGEIRLQDATLSACQSGSLKVSARFGE